MMARELGYLCNHGLHQTLSSAHSSSAKNTHAQLF